jgi:internalin A
MSTRSAVVVAVLFVALLGAGLGLFVLLSDNESAGPTYPYMPPEDSSKADEVQRVAIEKLGGKARRMDYGPVSSVEFTDLTVGDQDIAVLNGLTEMRELDLSGTKISDAALIRLKEHRELGTLRLARTAISGATLADLEALPGLNSLDLAGTRVTDQALAKLAGLRGLAVLDLTDTAVTDAGLVHLKGLPNLRTLVLSGTAVTDAGVALLADFKLEVLGLTRTRITSKSVPVLRTSRTLFSVWVKQTKLTADEVEELAEWFGLRGGRLRGLIQSDESLRMTVETSPAGVAALLDKRVHVFDEDRGDDADAGEAFEKVIDLSRSPVTDASVALLRGNHEYTALLLRNTDVTGAGLGDLAGQPNLRILSLAQSPVTDAALAHLAAFPALDTVALGHTGVTDAGLPAVAKVKGLGRLDLTNTKVTDAGLPALTGLDRLRALQLGGTAVTDAGLKHLEALKGLRYLTVGGTKVTDEGIRRLSAALPGCRVSRSAGPMILGLPGLGGGVSPPPPPGPGAAPTPKDK